MVCSLESSTFILKYIVLVGNYERDFICLLSFQKPSLRKSSSATTYSLNSHSGHLTPDPQPPSLSGVKPKAIPLGQSSRPGPSTVDKRNVRSDSSLKPTVPSLTKSSSWPYRPAVTARTTAGESSGLTGSQR